MPSTDREEIAFGPFRLDLRSRCLTRDGAMVPIGGRALDVFAALAAAAGGTVSKNALLDHVWPGLVIGENSLQVQISTLRKVLGDGWITTIPGRGYRLTLPPDATGPPLGSWRDPSTHIPPWCRQPTGRAWPSPAYYYEPHFSEPHRLSVARWAAG